MEHISFYAHKRIYIGMVSPECRAISQYKPNLINASKRWKSSNTWE